MTEVLSAGLQAIERRLRLLVILVTCGDVGIDPVSGHALHALAYLTDALAPVWNLPVAEAQLLKRRHRPFFPALQADLDWLVGAGLVHVHKFSYERDDDGHGWRLVASYRLALGPASRVFDAADRLEGLKTSVSFVREVVLASAALGELAVSQVGDVDAAYGSRLVDLGGVLDLDGERLNATAFAARRFGQLVDPAYRMSSAELVHLYVRHLTRRAA